MTPLSEQQNYFPDISRRFCIGRLVEKDKGVWLTINNTTRPYVNNVKIVDTNALGYDLIINKQYEIFLLSPEGKKENKTWFASLKWNRIEKNPWYYAPYRLGDDVIGTVTDYVQDHEVIVTLTDGIETHLHINELKGLLRYPTNNIRDILSIGDLIRGEIIHFAPEYVYCQISIRNAYSQNKKFFLDKLNNKEEITEKTRPLLRTQPQILLTKSQEVLIIDDNKSFRSGLSKWLENLGIKCTISCNVQKIHQLLEGDKQYFIFLDYDLGDAKLEKDIELLLSNQRQHKVLVCSTKYEAQKLAKKHNWFYNPKPLPFEIINAFLTDKITSRQEPGEQLSGQILLPARPEGMWQSELPEVTNLLNRITNYLQDLCRNNRASAVLWINVEREGVFNIQAQYGIDDTHPEFKNLRAGLVHTLVADVIKTGKTRSTSYKNSGKLLNDIAPENCEKLIACPLFSRDDQIRADNIQTERVLLFFFNEETSSATVTSGLIHALPILERFIENLTLLDHINELRAFAPLGLAAAGLTHELSNRISPLNNLIAQLTDLTTTIQNNSAAPKTLESKLLEIPPLLQKECDGIAEILSANLSMIRLKKTRKYSLQKLIRDISCVLRYSSKERRDKKGGFFDGMLPITLELPKEELYITLPIMSVEQPLINLINNSIYQIQKQGWGEIIVRLSLHPDEPQTPIFIEIEDNGQGISRDEMQTLFKPRATSRSINGNGLGLFLSRKMVELVGGKLEDPISIRWYKTIFILKLPMNFEEVR